MGYKESRVVFLKKKKYFKIKYECDVTLLSIPGGPLITEDAAGNFILVGILEAETSTKVISNQIINCLFPLATHGILICCRNLLK